MSGGLNGTQRSEKLGLDIPVSEKQRFSQVDCPTGKRSGDQIKRTCLPAHEGRWGPPQMEVYADKPGTTWSVEHIPRGRGSESYTRGKISKIC